MTQEKWKSPVLWGAVFAQIVSLLILLGVIDTGLGDLINNLIAVVLEMLVTFGVLNNPNSKTTF